MSRAMARPLNLENASEEEFRSFLDSFDYVLTDCDGVLWNMSSPIDGALASLSRLRALKKKVYFVSNNSTITVAQYLKKLKGFGFETTKDRIIIPSLVAASYLRNIDFEGKAYVISMAAYKSVLIDAGIDVATDNLTHVEEELSKVITAGEDDPSIKAVICDFDPNCNWWKLMQSSAFLKRDDCIYIAGALDLKIPVGRDTPLLGPGPFTNTLSEFSGRKPILTAKPSELLKKYVLGACDITEPRRCVFIGDTSYQDMLFGKMCGFQKFFVASGITTLEESMENEDTVPDVYLPSLGHLLPLLDAYFPANETTSCNS